MESSIHDKDSFAKEQTTFSGSKSLQRVSRITNNKPASNDVQNPSKTIVKLPEEAEKSTKNIEKVSNKTIEANAGFSKRLTVAELFLKESERSKNEGKEVTETINKFDKMDLYKSIFLSDSEDEQPQNVNNQSNIEDFTEKAKNVQRNTSPPRGIFANIDFDELNSWRRNVEEKQTNVKEIEKDTNEVKKVEETALYGPQIPDNLKKRLESENLQSSESSKPDIQEIDSSSSSDSWVEMKELKKKRKKKKVKKHKSKHKKSKSKNKKKDK